MLEVNYRLGVNNKAFEGPAGKTALPLKDLIRPLKGLIRPLKGLIRPFKGLIRPLSIPS